LLNQYAGNYNTPNGLVNRAYGSFKASTIYADKHKLLIPIILKSRPWKKCKIIQFQHNANDFDFEWMLIKALTQDIKVKKMQPCLIMKSKFLVQHAAAKTIQQAQGLTMDELRFHPTDVPYATLSHICTKEKLYFSAPLHFHPDNFHITIKKKWQNYHRHLSFPIYEVSCNCTSPQKEFIASAFSRNTF
jgi:hypothetical protein